MLRKLVASALFAGFATGLIAAALQFIFVVPLIIEGERYESGELVHFDRSSGAGGADPAAGDALADHDHGDHDHGTAQDGPGLSRHVLTVLASVAVYTGFGLLMVAGFALARRAGHEVTARAGLVWGLAGFVAVQLLPAAGLAPELPGSSGADLQARQIWWLATAAASVAGLAAIAFGRGWPVWVGGAALLVVPHIIGAPHHYGHAGVAPPELAAAFVGRALAVGAAAWTILGLTAAFFWSRQSP